MPFSNLVVTKNLTAMVEPARKLDASQPVGSCIGSFYGPDLYAYPYYHIVVLVIVVIVTAMMTSSFIIVSFSVVLLLPMVTCPLVFKEKSP